MVGFEPTNTGATTQGLNHLTTPTTLAHLPLCVVTILLVLSYIHRYAPFALARRSSPNSKLAARFYYAYVSKKALATGNGLEPSTSSVTGWHSNQLNSPAKKILVGAIGLEPMTPCL